MWLARSNNVIDTNNANGNTAATKMTGAGTRKFGVDLTANQNNNLTQRAGGKKTLKPVEHSKKSSSVPSSTETSSSQSEKQRHQNPARFENIDEVDRLDPQAVAEYSQEIHQHFRTAEREFMPAADYMDRQRHINIKMRAILIDWLVEVHLKFRLMPETLYLTINLIDRYLAIQPCPRRRLQLVGVTCMLLASKYEEIYFPEVQDFVYITDNAYSRADILRMEGQVLNTLKFDLTVPTALPFLKRFLKAAKADSKITFLSHFFVERMLQEYSMLNHTPSMIAASAVSMALRVNHRPTWSQTLRHYTGYTPGDLEACMRRMTRIVLYSPKVSLQAIRKKYGSHKYGSVSLVPFHRHFSTES